MIDKLERKFGKYAIKGLMKYIIILYAAGFLINLVSPTFYNEWLMLDIDKLLKGQVWRLITFIIQPTDVNNVFRVFLSMYVYFMFGISLEGMWGSFRFNLYYFSGIFFNILAVIGIYIFAYSIQGFGYSYPIDLTYLNLTLFLAFAVTFPETRFGFFGGGRGGISMFAFIYIMAVAVDVVQAFNYYGPQMGIATLLTNLVWMAIFCFGPKAKYMAIAYLVLIGVDLALAFADGWQWGVVILIAVVASLLNFLIYFISLKKKGFAPNNPARRMYQQAMRQNARNVEAYRRTRPNGPAKITSIYRPSDKATMHKCAICGRTEKDDDSLEFRFCSKCNGNYEYCSDHLYTHEHKT